MGFSLILSALMWALVQKTSGNLLGGSGDVYYPPRLQEPYPTLGEPEIPLSPFLSSGTSGGAGCAGYSVFLCPQTGVPAFREPVVHGIEEIVDVKFVDELTGQVLGGGKESYDITNQFYPYGNNRFQNNYYPQLPLRNPVYGGGSVTFGSGGVPGYLGGLQIGYQGELQSGYQGGLQGGYQGGLQSGYQGGLQSGYQGVLQGGSQGLQGEYQSGLQGGYQGLQGGYQGLQGGSQGFQGGYQSGLQGGYQGGLQGGYQSGFSGGLINRWPGSEFLNFQSGGSRSLGE